MQSDKLHGEVTWSLEREPIAHLNAGSNTILTQLRYGLYSVYPFLQLDWTQRVE